MFTIVRSAERYHAQHGWLDTYHSFSFADYFDPNNVSWGALRVFNDDTIAPAQGFPTHPHRDMEIITYIFSGELEHRDSLGNHGVVSDGGVQFMSAGTGVRHSEFNGSAEQPLHLVQMWVLPGKLGVRPTYGQIDFSKADRTNRWLPVASGQPAVVAPIALTQGATLRVARLESGALRHEFAPERFGFLFVGAGSIEVNEHGLEQGDAFRTHGRESLKISGKGEVVLWDTPRA
ncbi:MAG: quercetin 2,3-dioxygenase [Candidatus Meridianibacter frigidus]|nr:MAG: quercetin 2,3-dioxygenase [Candidatus Eremiobacteraeota bacterium]